MERATKTQSSKGQSKLRASWHASLWVKISMGEVGGGAEGEGIVTKRTF